MGRTAVRPLPRACAPRDPYPMIVLRAQQSSQVTLTLDICVCILGTSKAFVPPIISHPLCASSACVLCCIACRAFLIDDASRVEEGAASACLAVCLSACLAASCFCFGLCDGLVPSQIARSQCRIAMRSPIFGGGCICLYCGGRLFFLRARASWCRVDGWWRHPFVMLG